MCDIASTTCSSVYPPSGRAVVRAVRCVIVCLHSCTLWLSLGSRTLELKCNIATLAKCPTNWHCTSSPWAWYWALGSRPSSRSNRESCSNVAQVWHKVMQPGQKLNLGFSYGFMYSFIRALFVLLVRIMYWYFISALINKSLFFGITILIFWDYNIGRAMAPFHSTAAGQGTVNGSAY